LFESLYYFSAVFLAMWNAGNEFPHSSSLKHMCPKHNKPARNSKHLFNTALCPPCTHTFFPMDSGVQVNILQSYNTVGTHTPPNQNPKKTLHQNL